MNITAKKMGVMFSVALNIGFIIVAVWLIYNHPPPHYKGGIKKGLEIVSLMGLPADVAKSVSASMKKMEATHEKFVQQLHQTRNEGIRLLARPGPIDRDRFEALHDKGTDLINKNSRNVQKHLLEVRRRLGDEKGAQFFSELLKDIQKRDLKGLSKR